MYNTMVNISQINDLIASFKDSRVLILSILNLRIIILLLGILISLIILG
jgi:hypothetical protein